MKKGVVACILAVACIASLNGCGSKFNGQDTVVEVGDEKVTADVANFLQDISRRSLKQHIAVIWEMIFGEKKLQTERLTKRIIRIQSWILWKKCIFWMSTRMIIKFR